MDMSLFSSDRDRHSSDKDEDLHQSIDVISSEFNKKIDMENSNNHASQQLLPDPEVHVHEEHEDCDSEGHEEGNDDDFTFMFIGANDLPGYDDKVFGDGQIQQVFPLFDQNLLVNGEYDVEEIDPLLVMPPVDKIFIESPRSSPPATASGHEDNNDAAAGPYCVWSRESAIGTTELTKKSNSTGFSKLWRLKEKVGRSNSDGRDAFVFLKHPVPSSTKSTTSPSPSTSSSSTMPITGDGLFVKVNAAGGKPRVVKQGTKAKNHPVSAHEAYMRNRVLHTEEERRRSYLPYRQDLMGFFTNVNGGLSKNVHPY